ncbi:MAG: hypothetical protein Q9183_000369 [Haloplaca sp. 2 TL-2023]
MRPEPHSVPRADIAHFQRLLEALTLQCSSANIQLCKDWLLKNTALSATKTAAIGKYLVALASSLSASPKKDSSRSSHSQRLSGRRQQLHVLYLLHDFLHHTRYHVSELADDATSHNALEPYVLQLFAIISAYQPSECSQHFRKLHAILDIWAKEQYYPLAYIETLRETVEKQGSLSGVPTEILEPAALARGAVEAATTEGRKNAPYIMPPCHGDISDPFYDQPAGNLLPHIVPNSMVPIKPHLVQPLQLNAGSASEDLANAVEALLQDASDIYGAKTRSADTHKSDFNALGQPVLVHGSSKDVADSEGYYGWSKSFCTKMKLRDDRDPSRSPARHYHSNQRHRKAASSGSSDVSRSRSRSMSTSRSPPYRRGGLRQRRPSSDSASGSRGRTELRRFHQEPGNLEQSRNGSRTPRSRSSGGSYSPPDISPSRHVETGPQHRFGNGSPSPGMAHAIQPPPFLAQAMLGPGQVPIPPPRPPNYSGPWTAAASTPSSSTFALVSLFSDDAGDATVICYATLYFTSHSTAATTR